MTTNEAAERLLYHLRAWGFPAGHAAYRYLDEALAAAKAEEAAGWRAMLNQAEKVCAEKIAAAKAEGAREAVERIRSRVIGMTGRGEVPFGKHPKIDYLDTVFRREVFAILDKEAAR